jgi:hypothetical protein
MSDPQTPTDAQLVEGMSYQAAPLTNIVGMKDLGLMMYRLKSAVEAQHRATVGLTKWLIGLTAGLFALTLALVALAVATFMRH